MKGLQPRLCHKRDNELKLKGLEFANSILHISGRHRYDRILRVLCIKALVCAYHTVKTKCR